MRFIGFRSSALSILAVLAISGCGPPGSPSQGIGIYTAYCQGNAATLPTNTCLPGSQHPIPHLPVSGTYNGPYPSTGQSQTQGTVDSFGVPQFITTDKNGLLVVNNGKAPAYWNMNVLMPYNTFDPYSPGCGAANYVGSVYYEDTNWWEYTFNDALISNYYPNQTVYEENCYQYGALSSASTRFAILGNLPNSLTLGSDAPLMTQYGMPLLYVYDKTGTVVTTVTATNVSGDGSQATFPFPSSLTQNAYALALVNQTGSSPGYAPDGSNYLSIAQSTTIAGNPFGVSVGGQTYTFLETNTCTRPPTKTTSSSYSTFPVISLYSNNQVEVGGTTIGVGANPTAVATYQANPVTINSTYGCESLKQTYAGTTRAIVANSGSNTVSILDIVNDVTVATVTVGNRPVALAATADGSYAYVANYADGTVTRVDLHALTPSTPISVGGSPTSVALTSGGTLWVGGAGFLTEINTSTMSVVGTESVAGKTILALGFSDQVNELIATSTDTSGNVHADELSPSTFHGGGTYTPVASHQISTLGTYQVNGQQIRAFTSTLAGTTFLNTDQVGAPPLVVQDGWAVVTATPTGFTITDASGHLVLVSETTPSPITAIAVDAKLNVAYLTMPDSNTLLTVPLPGTN